MAGKKREKAGNPPKHISSQYSFLNIKKTLYLGGKWREMAGNGGKWRESGGNWRWKTRS
jgi:hypothetical protein